MFVIHLTEIGKNEGPGRMGVKGSNVKGLISRVECGA